MMIKNIMSSFVCIICFLFVFMFPALAAELIKIELSLYVKSVSVFQASLNNTYFRIINEHNDSLYSVTPKYLTPTGIQVSFNPDNIYEVSTTDRPVIVATIIANENAVVGTNTVYFWVESMDSNGNKVKSKTYPVDVTILINSTIPERTTSITTSTYTPTTTLTTYEFTTISEPLVDTGDENIPKRFKGGISKTQVLIILVIVMIILILMPLLSFKERFTQKKEISTQENKSEL